MLIDSCLSRTSLKKTAKKRAVWSVVWIFVFLIAMLVSLPSIAQAQTTLQVRLHDTGIQPSSFTAISGEPVNITVVNQGKSIHNFVVPDFYIFTQNLKPGEQVKVSFTPDKTGAFPYYSDTGGQPEPGIQGTIRVHA